MLARSLLAAAVLLVPMLAHPQSSPTRTPVLVELFTSEGCSSCPPADALLARLDREQPIPTADIIVLGEHVDYWDALGWRDRFSSHSFTERQSRYSNRFRLQDIYTPQMVVNGVAQCNGADPRAASKAIVQAARSPGFNLTLTEPKLDANHLSAAVSLAQPTPSALQGDLWAALVSPMQTTVVRSGENGGHTLRHAGVVRSLTRIGQLTDLARGPRTFTLAASDSTQPMRLVVFAQSANQGPILGVAALPIPAQSRQSIATAQAPH